MQLTQNQVETILQVALSCINRPYEQGFRCVDFVRYVYHVAGIEIPPLTPGPPPQEFNIKKEELDNPPMGHLIFLLDRDDPRKERAWTHIAIVLFDGLCIHNSLFFGKKVVVSPLKEMYKKYDFAPSAAAQ